VTAKDTLGSVDLRNDPAVVAGALAWEAPDIVTGWHHHPYHQLEYAIAGVAEVDTDDGRYLLPRQQAIWIPAGVEHNSTLRGVSAVSIFLRPDDLAPVASRAAVLAVSPLLREMLLHALRWPIDRPARPDAAADAFFATLCHLIAELLDSGLPIRLPAADDPAVAAVIERTVDDLAGANLAGICADVGISERSLRRRIRASTGMTWSEYLTVARVLRATSLLASTELGVIEIAMSVGFESPSGFARAFRRLTGTTPTAYRSSRLGR